MVAVSMRNENIVNATEVYPQFLSIADKNITGPSIQQDPVPVCL